MKHRAFTLWEALAVSGIVILLAAILFPVFARTHCSASRASCQSNLKQIGIALKLYSEDYDNTYPFGRQQEYQSRKARHDHASGWARDLEPYVGDLKIYQCPSRKFLVPTATDYTDYYFNNRLASLDGKRLVRPASTVQLGDGNDGKIPTTASYAYNEMPTHWRRDKNSPAYRHQDGANYGFADGHVKWLRADKIATEQPTGKNFTFAVR